MCGSVAAPSTPVQSISDVRGAQKESLKRLAITLSTDGVMTLLLGQTVEEAHNRINKYNE